MGDVDNKELGYSNHMEYFDCEMDISQGNTVGRSILAFMPYGKYPRTSASIITLGFRQILAYIALFPRAEKCGLHTKWSQSPTNPTTDFEITIKYKGEPHGEKLYYRGRKTNIQMSLRANGQHRRAYRLQINVENSPNRLKNKVAIQMNRAPVPALGIAAYTACLSYNSQYPDFGNEYMGHNLNQKMAVMGEAKVRYGVGTECGTQGDIKVEFNHATTQQGRDDLKQKWYYKQCMAQKQSPEWRARGGNKLPTTEPCWLTLSDATNARHYHWDVKFVKLTNRMKNIISNARAIIQAGLIPYYDEDPSASSSLSGNDVGPFMKVDVVFKNADKAADVKIETSQGTKEYKDYPLKLEWTKRLRNLRFDGKVKRFMDMKIIAPCVATTQTVQTMDNVTYPYQASSCWTLTSGHCGPNPAYAVFTKKVGNKLAIKAYFGGHNIEIDQNGGVKVNGAAKSLTPGKEEVFKNDDVEIFKYVKWGSTVHVYSFMRVWVPTDNTFVQVLPAPSTRGQHCGICGTFNRNIYDEWMGKDGQTLMTSANSMVDEWKWKC